jgi:hypothetical protein
MTGSMNEKSKPVSSQKNKISVKTQTVRQAKLISVSGHRIHSRHVLQTGHKKTDTLN